MLQLTANGNTLIISEATSFNLTLKSPLAGNNPGSYVFSVTLPYEGNAKHFNWPYRLTRMNVVTAQLPGEIIYNWVHVQKGEWKARSSNGQTINLEMVIGSGHFNTLVEGKKLPEYFDIETSYGDIIAHINSQITKTYPEVNHQFPCISNPSFYGDVSPNYGGLMNDCASGFVSDIVNHTNIVPQLFLFYIVKHLFASQQYNPFGPVFNDTYLQKQLLYNNYAIDKLESVFFSGEVVNKLIPLPNFTVKWDTNIVDPQNNYTQSTGQYLVSSWGSYTMDLNFRSKINEYHFGVDTLTVEFVYDSVVYHSFDYTVVGDPEDYMTIAISYIVSVPQSLINRNFEVRIYYTDDRKQDFEAYISNGDIKIVNITNPEENIFGDTINYKNHVPNMDVKTFLNAFYASQKILPFFNHSKKTVELVFFKDILASRKVTDLSEGLKKYSLKVYSNDYKGLTFGWDWQGPDNLIEKNFIPPETITGEVTTYASLTTNPSIGDVYYVIVLNAYYKYVVIEPEEPAEGEDPDPITYEWIAISDKHYPVVYDDGKQPINSPMAPMLMRCVLNGSSYINVPSLDAEGTSIDFGIENEFPLRVMNYTGLTRIGHVSEYPYATTTKYNNEGTVVLPINHTWEDLITQYWVPIILWYKRRLPIDFINTVAPAFISKLDLQSKFYFQQTKILLGDISIKIKNKMFGPGKFKGWG